LEERNIKILKSEISSNSDKWFFRYAADNNSMFSKISTKILRCIKVFKKSQYSQIKGLNYALISDIGTMGFIINARPV
jgi:hypothetical protein